MEGPWGESCEQHRQETWWEQGILVDTGLEKNLGVQVSCCNILWLWDDVSKFWLRDNGNWEVEDQGALILPCLGREKWMFYVSSLFIVTAKAVLQPSSWKKYLFNNISPYLAIVMPN